MVIAIDGPAASGKGTLARRLAAHFGLPHLDSGRLYRAAALCLLEGGASPDDAAAAAGAARSIGSGHVASPRLNDPDVAQLASRIAAIPEVRAALIERQRRFAATAPGAVIDGRDIGTVVCPDADYKLFVDARPEIRARRRLAELRAAGVATTLEEVAAELSRRDRRDRERAVAPLRPAPDAIVIDTSDLGVEEMVGHALARIEERRCRPR
jgi:cytidylate kinase